MSKGHIKAMVLW